MTTAPLPATDPESMDAVLAAIRRVLAPVARLCVAQGVSWASLEALAKSALVDAACAARPDLADRGRVSHVSAATGIQRREVARVLATAAAPAAPRIAPAASVFARWRADARLRDEAGRPRPLPRVGPEPSFEWLARSLTSSVHPRTLLDELCRLGLASLDEATDRVHLDVQSFVPRGDADAMFGLLGANVGDHLDGAVDNVLADGRRHIEQAVYADGLSEASAAVFRREADAQWRRLAAEMVPLLEGLLADDRASDRPRPARVRIGLYAYDDGATDPGRAAGPTPRAASTRRRLVRPDAARAARRPGTTDPKGPTR